MIQVKRGAEPAGFAADSAAWKQQFEEKQYRNRNLSPSEFWATIRQQAAMKQYAEILRQRFHGKCAFCESKKEDLQIEHFRPKDKNKYPELMFVWDNWLIACSDCNKKKGSKFPLEHGKACFIDPVTENPAEHVEFLESHILSKSTRGNTTIQEIQLNRTILTEARSRWLTMTINSLLLLCSLPQASSAAKELLIWSMQADAPYAAMTRQYLNKKVPKLANPPAPHPFIEIANPQKRIGELMEQYREQLLQLE